MMNILKEIVETAAFNRQQGHIFGAMTLALVAFAATGRKRYPHPQYGDGDSFRRFGQETLPAFEVNFKGKPLSMEHILYKLYRCELVHEADLPDDVEFVDDGRQGIAIQAGDPLKLEGNWVGVLLSIVTSAPENEAIFHAGEIRRTLNAKTSEDDVLKTVSDKYGISPQRLMILKWLIGVTGDQKLTPEKLGELVVKRFGGGAITGLSRTRPPHELSLAEHPGVFTPLGVQVLDEIRSMYNVTERVIQPEK
jgi:hypothetical protein